MYAGVGAARRRGLGASLPPAGVPHISTAPFDVQVEEAYMHMLRQGAPDCPDWSTGWPGLVCEAAKVAYHAKVTEGLGPESWEFFPQTTNGTPGSSSSSGQNGGTAPTVELGLEYPVTTAGPGAGAVRNWLAIGAVGLALLLAQPRRSRR